MMNTEAIYRHPGVRCMQCGEHFVPGIFLTGHMTDRNRLLCPACVSALRESYEAKHYPKPDRDVYQGPSPEQDLSRFQAEVRCWQCGENFVPTRFHYGRKTDTNMTICNSCVCDLNARREQRERMTAGE